MLCRGQPVLPMGFTDEPNYGMVKLFCPKCRDVYSCPNSQRHLDGAFFGPTFPNLFFMTYEGLAPEPASEQYVPTVFGFKIHSSSNSLQVTSSSSSSSSSSHHRSSNFAGGGGGGGEFTLARSKFIGNGNSGFGVHGFGHNATGGGERSGGVGGGVSGVATTSSSVLQARQLMSNGPNAKSDVESAYSSAHPLSAGAQQSGTKRLLAETKQTQDKGDGGCTGQRGDNAERDGGGKDDTKKRTKRETHVGKER